MFNERTQNIGFFILLGAAAILALFLFWPFLELLALAGILAVLFKPWYERLVRKTKSETSAGLLTVLLVLIIVLVPLFLIGYALYGEIVNLYNSFANGGLNLGENGLVKALPEALQDLGRSFLIGLSERVSTLAGATVRSVTTILSNVANFLLGCFLVFFSLYYFLRDGDKIKELAGAIFPLSRAHGIKLIDELEKAISGVVKGSFLIALTQGVVATVGFLIFGVPHPFIWGAVTVLAALVPTFGTSLSIVPAVLYLLLTGHTGAAVGLVIWGAVAVGLIDNFISPRVIGSKANLHPLVVLLAVLGGIQLFGVLGFLLGPIMMAVFITLLNIYRTGFKD